MGLRVPRHGTCGRLIVQYNTEELPVTDPRGYPFNAKPALNFYADQLTLAPKIYQLPGSVRTKWSQD